MGTYGNSWELMGTHGNFSAWELMRTYGNLWKLMGTYGNLWEPMGTYGTYGNLWELMGTSCGVTYGNLWETHTYLRSNFVDFLNLYVCWEQKSWAETYVVSKFLSRNVCWVKILEPKGMLCLNSRARTYVVSYLLGQNVCQGRNLEPNRYGIVFSIKKTKM